MIEQETVLALIEAKENLERAQDIIHTIRLDADGSLQEQPQRAHLRVTWALALIESILAKGR